MINYFKNQFNSLKGDIVFRDLKLDSPDSYLFVEDVRKGLNHYYLDDPEKLDEAKRKWRFKKKDWTGRCGYDFHIRIKPDKGLRPIGICFMCNTLSLQTDGNSTRYEIDEARISMLLEEDFKPVRIVKKSFKNKEEAMAFWESENKELIMNPEKIPDWVKYDGKFTTVFKVDDPIPPSFENNKSRIKFFNQIFHKRLEELRYKDGFLASYYGPTGEEKEYFFDFYCKKDFWENFEGIKKEDWKPYSKFDLDLMFK